MSRDNYGIEKVRKKEKKHADVFFTSDNEEAEEACHSLGVGDQSQEEAGEACRSPGAGEGACRSREAAGAGSRSQGGGGGGPWRGGGGGGMPGYGGPNIVVQDYEGCFTKYEEEEEGEKKK